MKFTCLIGLSTRIPKIHFFFEEAPISKERWPENLGEIGNSRDTVAVGGQFRKRIPASTPGTKIFVMP